jgi:hypothetical protein
MACESGAIMSGILPCQSQQSLFKAFSPHPIRRPARRRMMHEK